MLSVTVGSQGHPMLGLKASHDGPKQNHPMKCLFTKYALWLALYEICSPSLAEKIIRKKSGVL